MIHVKAFRDKEAGVWVATSDDVPGLVTEVQTSEGLSENPFHLIFSFFGSVIKSVRANAFETYLR